jgi:hypothetical protein
MRFLQSPDKWVSIWCHDEIVQMASKKQGTSASAGSPNDFVSVAGSVRVPQNLISGIDLTRIDFLMN